jgi:hypothetical protein
MEQAMDRQRSSKPASGGSKKEAHDTNLDRDLRGNPGIGQSKGGYAMAGAKDGSLDDLEDAEGVNTVEGDVENEAGPFGEASEGKLGRTNR